MAGLYLHIPFCEHKCIYCDFYSIISYSNVSTYLEALKKEIRNYAADYSEGRKIISIFFGGGTPSLLQPSEVEEILNLIATKFSIQKNAEITFGISFAFQGVELR